MSNLEFVQIKYTYGLVVATLACVEDPQPSVYLAVHESEAPDHDDKTKSSPTEPLLSADIVTDGPPEPITSSLKSAVRHLRARAGPWSRFRGFHIFLVWLVTRAGLARCVLNLFGRPEGLLVSAFADIAAEVAMAGLATAWIHTVIAEPLSTPFWLRTPAFRAWRQVAPAAALKAAANQLGFVLPALLAVATRLIREDGTVVFPAMDSDSSEEPSLSDVVGALGVMGLSLALTVLVEIPATVAMVRVAASLLPDHVESIVPFDRSFGGRAIPEEGRKLGVIAAWTTFSWSARMRLAKVLLKTFAMIMMLGVTFASIITGVLVYYKQ